VELYQGKQLAGPEKQILRQMRRQIDESDRAEEVPLLWDGQIPQGSHDSNLKEKKG